MRPLPTLSLTVGLLLLIAGRADSHHAFSPVYDGSRTITIEGVLTEFRLVNPHATMTIDVSDDSGNVVTWTVEMAGSLSLTRQGWTTETFAVGERLTVNGNPTHTDSSRIAFRQAVLADGTTLLDPGDANRSVLEEQRRQRSRERDQQN
jgi:hypothetical protein